MELDHERERERDINFERIRPRERERDRDRDRDRERERERDPREKESHQREGTGYIHSIVPAPVPRKPDDGTSHVGYSYSQASHFALSGVGFTGLMNSYSFRYQGHRILIQMHTTLTHHRRMNTPMEIRTLTLILTRTNTSMYTAIIQIILLPTHEGHLHSHLKPQE